MKIRWLAYFFPPPLMEYRSPSISATELHPPGSPFSAMSFALLLLFSRNVGRPPSLCFYSRRPRSFFFSFLFANSLGFRFPLAFLLICQCSFGEDTSFIFSGYLLSQFIRPLCRAACDSSPFFFLLRSRPGFVWPFLSLFLFSKDEPWRSALLSCTV